MVVLLETPPAAEGPSALPLATGVEVPPQTPPVSRFARLNKGMVGLPMTPPTAMVAPMLSAQADFINKLARHTVGLLPIPRSNKRKGKSRPPSEASRQSQQLAGKMWNLALKTCREE